MKKKYLFITASLILAAFASCSNRKAHDTVKPNIIFIMADDLGYGELGAYGQKKIETPNIDRLAENGMIFTQHYSGSPVCAPSRCILLTGLHSGHAQIRGNDEWAERGAVWDYREMIKNPALEGQRPIKAGTATIASILKGAGYKTAGVGKWGLGAPGTEGVPEKQGFDLFYGYNCQRQAHTYFPVHLWKNDQKIYLNNDTVAPGTKLKPGADPMDAASYSDFWLTDYSPDMMFGEIQDFVTENQDSPFFLYWATTIPHAAIQAPPEWVNYYVDKFGDEDPYTGDKGYFPNRYPHAAYAGMISYLDNQVGILIEQLKELGIYENTVIFFTSDNGPTYNGGTDSEWFNSAGQFREGVGLTKGSVHEGGIRVPMIASWPGIIPPGSGSDHISAFWDILPTLCDISGTPVPGGLDGISFLPALLGETSQSKHEYLYWEFPESGGQQAVRMDNWKAIRRDIRKGNLEIELYDLSKDPLEENNVTDIYPAVVERIAGIMKNEHTQSEMEVFRLQALGDYTGNK